ncbi:MAG: hypothetical protein K0R16_922 [Nitrososphaeraceae archaeon]|nr:hypothetical protein [Nitrososphaeraceae archaeon]
MQNSFPMREWHVEHMEKTVVKYVKGLSENASGWEKRNHKKYGSLANICRQIDYDIKLNTELAASKFLRCFIESVTIRLLQTLERAMVR